MSSELSSLLPQARPIPGDPEGGMLLNASAVIELMRSYSHDTPFAREFLAAYHTAEAKVAEEKPYFSEGKIREEAFMKTLRCLGIRVVPAGEDGKPLSE